ncbi:uncharacterized protein LOC114521065 isoform X2 [Dendronephthya gigantea]|nr:uncharacterized protein LOC114521065 isoform X2 [Dendronephthya gigantea]
MDNEDSSRENMVGNSSENSGNWKPERWTKAEVVKWIDSICDEYEIEKEEVVDLKRSNGKGLDLLKKEDWLRRSPTQGDMLYELWKQLKTEGSNSPKQPDIVFPEEKERSLYWKRSRVARSRLYKKNLIVKRKSMTGPAASVAEGGRIQIFNTETDPASSRSSAVMGSEDHPHLYEEKEEPSSPSSETSSQQGFAYLETFSAQVDGELLSVGSKIKKTNRRIFLPVTSSFDEIRKNVVAFKNSFDGDIFVGVEFDGEVSPRSLVEGDLVQWREKMAAKIGAILPGADDQVCFCKNFDEAAGKIGKECFISIIKLNNSPDIPLGIIWIHVPHGQEKIYFSKATDVPAFVRVGAETKRMNNYKELFSLLESLKYRVIRPSRDFEQIYEEARSNMASKHTYKLFKTKKAESHELEFKMVFSQDPVKKIAEEYISKYCCGFLNSHSGTIYFGVQEDEDTKEGLVVGIVLPDEQRNELMKRSIEVLQGFYPPVDFSQIFFRFTPVFIPFTSVLKYQDGDNDGKVVLLQGPGDEIGQKLPRFIKSKAEKNSNIRTRVIRINSESFCVVGENFSASENLINNVKDFQKNLKKSSLKSIEESDFQEILKDLCVVELHVAKSTYPVHLTKPLDTQIFDSNGNLISLSHDELIRRFEMKPDFNIDKFLKDVNNFDPAGNSYIMISSPFNLPPLEQDVFGLVIPNWTLAIDFDQDPKEDGHLFHLFEKLHDGYHKERDRCLVTPQSDKLDLNADHGVCWLAARGHRGIADSLSKESEGKNTWNITHRKMINTLLDEELTRNVMPSKIHVVIFWDRGCKSLSYSLNLLLADILSICDNTSVTLVCSTSEAHSDIDKDMKLLKENCTITNESNVHIAAPLHVLAKHLAVSLPETFRPEDDYQVPKKQYTENTSLVTVPTVLPQRLRQNIHGRLKMMYINKSRNVDEKKMDEERKKFYTGSQISMLGLRGSIGIEREKLKELDGVFQDLNIDKKSRISLIIVKADRGAGTTTMCLQFLYKHHEKIPCAQLIEIHRDLLSFIEKINQITNLPLLLLVDEDVGNLQDFLDFKKDAENRRTVNIIFLLVEPVQIDRKPAREGRSGKRKRQRRIGDSSLYGTSCCREITLKRELETVELEKLSFELLKICPNDARDKVTDLKNRALLDNSRLLRSFAYFSLTAFGKEFSDLSDYVKFRLQMATDIQKQLLAFLSLTHLFTGHKLPASALARYLNKDKVSMKSEFQNVYLQEMLSPPAQETDSRRISFLEVASEILNQLAEENEGEENIQGNYWLYIKDIAVEMASKVLSVNIGASKIDRLTRKLFIISEYESEKFSSLIRSMRYKGNADIARDTLVELVKVFRKHLSFRAHLLAHLGKYYMIEYSDFQNAKSRIEEAVKDVPNDALLHHIHGDIIRRYIDNLKSEETVNMQKIVQLAIESSSCFQEVRERRPQMSYGYVSDALVQITVMQACIKSARSDKDYGFVEYLIEMIERVKSSGKLGEQEKYLLVLITSAHEYLNESSNEYEHKDILRKKFNECIPKITELKTLCEKLEAERKNFSGQKAWIDEVSNRTNSLFLQLEIENNKDMTQDDFELRIKEIEERAFDEGSMKYWFRYVRKIRIVPSLPNVEKRVKRWIAQTKKMNIISPHAEFYNYVVAVLIALKDPNDDQKMQRAAELVKKQQRNKSAGDSRKIHNTLEWLCPKQGSHVNSIDSLLLSDDLLKDSWVKGKEIPLKERLESCLRKKNVSRWDGVVEKIKNDWHGTIKFRGHIDVYFLPQSIRSSKPAIGDTVSFHLSFDWHGPRAWSVERVADRNAYKKTSYLSDSGTEGSDDEKDGQATGYNAPRPLYFTNLEDNDSEENTWSHYVDKQMIGTVTAMKEEGYGFISHPDVEDHL